MKLDCSIIFAIIFTSAISSCIKSPQETLDDINIRLKQDFTESRLDSLSFIVIIPEEGCGGCITIAEDFYNNFSSKDDILFIFTNVLSVKTLLYKITVNDNNTIIDRNNEYISIIPTGKRIYPFILAMRDGQARAMISQSPGGRGFMEVEQYYLKRGI